MNIVLTRPSTFTSAPGYFPSGLGYIAGAMRDAGHRVKVLDAEAERLPLEDHGERLRALDYDVLCISALINKYGYVRDLAAASRRHHPDAKIVLGGNITGPIWELLLDRTTIDYLVIGEGEVTIAELLACVEKGATVENVAGIAHRNGGTPTRTRMREALPDLDAIPIPPYELFPMDTYLNTPTKLSSWRICQRDISMISSRGCPFKCTFCYRPPWERVRYRSAENVKKEVAFLIDTYGIEGVVFNDELTLAEKKRSYELCDAMEELGILWGCVGRVNTVDLDLLKRLYRSGCRWMAYGIESGSQQILNEMRKNLNVERALDVVRWSKQVGIRTNAAFMIGNPSETRETAMATVRFMKSAALHPEGIFYATPYPGTELFKQAVEMGRIDGERVEDYLLYIDGRDAHELLVNLTQMSDEELVELRNEVVSAVARPKEFWPRMRMVYREEGPRGFARRLIRLVRPSV